jgi:hypothetical protein
MEIVGENGLGDLFGQTEIEPIDAAAGREIYNPEHPASGVDPDRSLSAPGVKEPINESQRLEDFKRTGMYHRGAIPVERRGSVIDQVTWYTAPLKLRSEQQAGRPSTHYEHGYRHLHVKRQRR